MGFFNFFGDNEVRQFHYTPRYYDEEAEERRQKFGAVDGSLEKEVEKKKAEGTYVPGSYIKGALRNGNAKRTKVPWQKTQTIIGLVAALLIFTILIFIAKFYMLLP